MADRIGFIRFTMLDPPRHNDYKVYKNLSRVMEPGGHVKSLAETHPPQPPWRFEAPEISLTADRRLYKLAAELAPGMNEFYDRALDLARVREQLKVIERNRHNSDEAAFAFYRQVDLLHAWITELLFERVYRRVGRQHDIFEKLAKREWLDARTFLHEHREKRVEEARIFPELHEKELVHPFRNEIKLPNDKKARQQELEFRLADREHLKAAKEQLQTLRHLLHQQISEHFTAKLRQQFIAKRNERDHQAHWHLHDVRQAFEKAWTHAWDRSDVFRQLIRQGIMDQAELFPRLYQKALRDPYELDIRLPNQKNIQENILRQLQAERQQLAWVKLEEIQGRQLTQDHKKELRAYRQLNAIELEDRREQRTWENHVLLQRSDSRQLEDRDHTFDRRRAESQGYQLLADRLIPQPQFSIKALFASSLPLELGLHGNPRAHERIAASPLQRTPDEQKEALKKARAMSPEAKSESSLAEQIARKKLQE